MRKSDFFRNLLQPEISKLLDAFNEMCNKAA